MKRTTRLLALVLALLMLATSLPFAFAEEPAAEPAAETAVTAEDAKEEPAKEEPTAQEPAKEEPSKEEPAKEEPAKEEPAKEEPTAQETAGEEPAAQEPETEPATEPVTQPVLPTAQSGALDENAAWTLSEEGLLTVTGTGELRSYKMEKNVPWAKWKAQIKNAVISNGVTAIGDKLFYECTNLETVSLPATLKKIGGWAFNGCSSLREVTLPEGLTDIAWYAFCDCKTLKEMIFPNSVKTIGASALSGCNHITNVKLPLGLEVVEYYLFRYCHGLREITIPNTVKEIGGGAFNNCRNLQEISLPRSVSVIGEYAFYDANDDKMALKRVSVYNGDCKIPEDPRSFPQHTVLRGYEGSTLEAFAKANGRTFESMPNIPEHDHVWGEAEVTTPATCLATGVRTYTCSVCGETREEEIPVTEHNPVTVPGVPATCKSTGLTESVSCSICGQVFTAPAILPKTGHNWQEKVTPAKIGKNGKLSLTCTVCKATKTETVAKINTVKLSDTAPVYDGTAKKPTVTVKDSNNDKLKKDRDYTLKYSKGRKNVGAYTVTVTFIGHYAGTKTLKFKIVPERVTNLKAKPLSGRKFSLTWNKAAGAKKYVVYYATSKNGTYNKIGTFSKNSLITTNYTAGRTYYFKVRAVTTVDGTNYFGAYSLIKHGKAKR